MNTQKPSLYQLPQMLSTTQESGELIDANLRQKIQDQKLMEKSTGKLRVENQLISSKNADLLTKLMSPSSNQQQIRNDEEIAKNKARANALLLGLGNQVYVTRTGRDFLI